MINSNYFSNVNMNFHKQEINKSIIFERYYGNLFFGNLFLED